MEESQITTLKETSVSDLPDSLIERHAVELGLYCVGFVNPGTNPPTLLGSGTLVRASSHHGILTASHVVSTFQKLPEVGLVVALTRHALKVPVETLNCIFSPASESEGEGPDLAFVRIPDTNVGAILAVRSFANLNVHRDRAASLEKSRGLWSIVGFPAERSHLKEQDGFLTLENRGHCGVGLPPEAYEIRGDFDYYQKKVIYSATNDVPQNYGGVSGGGLWQTEILKNDDGYSIGSRVLRGVAFYQSPRVESARQITCHGDSSIYEWLLPKIYERYGGNLDVSIA